MAELASESIDNQITNESVDSSNTVTEVKSQSAPKQERSQVDGKTDLSAKSKERIVKNPSAVEGCKMKATNAKVTNLRIPLLRHQRSYNFYPPGYIAPPANYSVSRIKGLGDSIRSCMSVRSIEDSLKSTVSLSDASIYSDPTFGMSLSRKPKRNVSFHEVQIREYERALGDNPSVSSGPALSLSWEYYKETEDSIPLDEYESYRPDRRSCHEMIIPRLVRQQILIDEYDFSRNDIRKAVKQINITKARRRQTVNNLKVHHIEEKLQNAKRKLKKIIMRQSIEKEQNRLWKAANKHKYREETDSCENALNNQSNFSSSEVEIKNQAQPYQYRIDHSKHQIIEGYEEKQEESFDNNLNPMNRNDMKLSDGYPDLDDNENYNVSQGYDSSGHTLSAKGNNDKQHNLDGKQSPGEGSNSSKDHQRRGTLSCIVATEDDDVLDKLNFERNTNELDEQSKSY